LAKRHNCSPERGFTLLTTGVCLVAMVGVLGLAVDVGRLYVVRNEIQAYVDVAALSAALELDGTSSGVTRAANAVATSTNRWNMGTLAFTGTLADFSTAPTGAWTANPESASNYLYVRVRASASLPLYFIPVLASTRSSTVQATAVAGQVLKTDFAEGLLPFSPFPHNALDPNFGYIPGEHYTLRWGPNPKIGPNVCSGDNGLAWLSIAEGGSASERGYIDDTSSAIIRAAIEQDYQTRPLAIGDIVAMTGGNKQTQRDSLVARVDQDTDPISATYAEYEGAGTGNGRRLVAVPINTWQPDYRVIGFAAFFLLPPSEYPQGGNKSFCAEYVGPFVQGSRHKGGGGPGAYVVRLVE
jgi:Flp pilus assembly protein TadG